MRLEALGEEYAAAARAIRERITLVEELKKNERDEVEKLRLHHRLRLLRGMYRDTREVAGHLKNYYKRGGNP